MSYHGFMMNYHDGVIVLCAMILAPKEICTEAAWYLYRKGIPFTKKPHRNEWVTREVFEDMLDMKKRIPQYKVADFYCMDTGQFSKLLKQCEKRYKEEG